MSLYKALNESFLYKEGKLLYEEYDTSSIPEGGFQIALSQALESHTKLLDKVGFYSDCIPDREFKKSGGYIQSWKIQSDFEDGDIGVKISYDAVLSISVDSKGRAEVSYLGKFTGKNKSEVKSVAKATISSDSEGEKLILKVAKEGLDKLRGLVSKMILDEEVGPSWEDRDTMNLSRWEDA